MLVKLPKKEGEKFKNNVKWFAIDIEKFFYSMLKWFRGSVPTH